MHSDKREALVMKIDLFKAYDSIEWSYVHLVFLKIGLSIPIIAGLCLVSLLSNML